MGYKILWRLFKNCRHIEVAPKALRRARKISFAARGKDLALDATPTRHGCDFCLRFLSRYPFWQWASLLIFTFISIMLGISFGSVSISFAKIFALIFPPHEIYSPESIIIQTIRIPHVINAFIVGASLGISGVLMQTLLRNPLADPYVLGISGGAAVFVLIALFIGCANAYLNIYAFIGSLLAVILVWGLFYTGRQRSPLQLLLIGIVTATFWAAVISLILTLSPEKNLRSMLFWLLGDLNYASFSIVSIILLGVGLGISLFLARALNIFMRGEKEARNLGVHTKQLALAVYLTASLLTALSVSLAGCIGFIGLIIPHTLRLLKGSDHRFLIPASFLLGGSLLVLSDAIARSVFSPIQLPVGIITAFIGVPVFLGLLRCRKI